MRLPGQRIVRPFPLPPHERANPPGTTLLVGNRECIQFCSNDFLCLAEDRRVQQAGLDGLTREGVGAGNAHAGGYRECHSRLEQAIAKALGSEDAVVFPSILSAQFALCTTVLVERDVTFCDADARDIIAQAIQVTQAKTVFFSSADLVSLEANLRQTLTAGQRYVFVESINGNIGSVIQLGDFAELCNRHRVALVVDETFAFGIIGRNGYGVVDQSGMKEQILGTIIGFDTLGGMSGGAIVGSADFCNRLRNESSAYANLPGLSPSNCYALEAIFEIVPQLEDERKILNFNAKLVYEGLKQIGYRLFGASGVPIISVVLRSKNALEELSQGLFERNILVTPATPHERDGAAMLRLTVSAHHKDTQITELLQGMEQLGRRLKFI